MQLLPHRGIHTRRRDDTRGHCYDMRPSRRTGISIRHGALRSYMDTADARPRFFGDGGHRLADELEVRNGPYRSIQLRGGRHVSHLVHCHAPPCDHGLANFLVFRAEGAHGDNASCPSSDRRTRSGSSICEGRRKPATDASLSRKPKNTGNQRAQERNKASHHRNPASQRSGRDRLCCICHGANRSRFGGRVDLDQDCRRRRC